MVSSKGEDAPGQCVRRSSTVPGEVLVGSGSDSSQEDCHQNVGGIKGQEIKKKGLFNVREGEEQIGEAIVFPTRDVKWEMPAPSQVHNKS